MLDIQFIRDNPDEVKEGIAKKNADPKLVDRFLRIDEEWKLKTNSLNDLLAEKNKLDKELAGGRTEDLMSKAQVMKKRIDELEGEVKELDGKRLGALNQLPNLPLSEAPVGKSENENVIRRTWGEPTRFDFKPKSHLELGVALGILDFDSGAKVAGSQFYFLVGDGALLEVALVSYAFELLSKRGYVPVITPDVVRSRYYLGTGYMPKGDEAQIYEIRDDDLGLIATAEIALAGKHADEIIPEEKLPLKYIGYSHCFRQEAGAYGKYSKGLYRVHQFTKTELFVYCKPEESAQYHKELLELEEELFQGLEIPYRALEMCTADLGAIAARKYDLEAWMPGREDYGEVTSTSNCTDFQARNLNIKFRRKDSKKLEFVHMLNGTAFATSRVIVAILENYQTKEGAVRVPKVLQRYMGKELIS